MNLDLELARHNMIEQQVRPWDVLDARVLGVLNDVHREDFVPAAQRSLAFADLSLPLGHDEVMMKPVVEGRLLQALALEGHESVLEIGTGSGFMAALLGHRAQRVLSLEIDDELARTAHANLQRAGVLNVEVRALDGARTDLSAHGPFDVIVLSGSVAELPDALLALLKPGGRLMAIVGHEPVMRATLVLRTDNGLVSSQPWDSNAPRLCHFPEPSRFQF